MSLVRLALVCTFSVCLLCGCGQEGVKTDTKNAKPDVTTGTGKQRGVGDPKAPTKD
jgi:hypothetical protein